VREAAQAHCTRVVFSQGARGWSGAFRRGAKSRRRDLTPTGLLFLALMLRGSARLWGMTPEEQPAQNETKGGSSLEERQRSSIRIQLVFLCVGLSWLLQSASKLGAPARGFVIGYCSLAAVVLAQSMRYFWFPERMPRRWSADDPRLARCRTIEKVFLLGSCVAVPVLCALCFIARPLLLPYLPLGIWNWFVVQSLFFGFLRDHRPLPVRIPSVRDSFWAEMRPIRSDHWGVRGAS
jgi:hypothetical protein